ncbi:MAG: hypothetical protein PHZ07_04615 [Patescibacteria group bacterium]|nr:hypothetical protein [Patescibacteria group bacterium]MDD4304582.1 hypothetical protein [Patescibacteria group bacterium]MDD4695617.1 hypothetical protein [Patescibacteria group bacterium]
MPEERLRPICLLIISGLDAEHLNDNDFNLLSKFSSIYPLVFLESNYKNITDITNSYIELGTGTHGLDKSEKSSKTSLSEVLSFAGSKQLHISETEDYANLTFFFNGKKRNKNLNEDWFQVKSPKMDNYLDNPDMMISKIQSKLIESIEKRNYDFIVTNFNNLLCNFKSDEDKKRAFSILDRKIKNLVDVILSLNGALFITSNISFRNSSLPLLMISKEWKNRSFIDYDHSKGILDQKVSARLFDIAPTILKVMGITKHKQMQGESII